MCANFGIACDLNYRLYAALLHFVYWLQDKKGVMNIRNISEKKVAETTNFNSH